MLLWVGGEAQDVLCEDRGWVGGVRGETRSPRQSRHRTVSSRLEPSKVKAQEEPQRNILIVVTFVKTVKDVKIRVSSWGCSSAFLSDLGLRWASHVVKSRPLGVSAPSSCVVSWASAPWSEDPNNCCHITALSPGSRAPGCQDSFPDGKTGKYPLKLSVWFYNIKREKDSKHSGVSDPLYLGDILYRYKEVKALH